MDIAALCWEHALVQAPVIAIVASFWDRRRFSAKATLCWLLANPLLAFVIKLVDIYIFHLGQFGQYTVSAAYMVVFGFPLYLVLFRAEIRQWAFLFFCYLAYEIILFGLGNWANMTFAGAFFPDGIGWPKLLVSTAAELVSLPPLVLALRRLFTAVQDGAARLWNVVWLIPVIFSGFCMLSGNIYMPYFSGLPFLLSRVITYLALFFTIWLVGFAMRQADENATLRLAGQKLDMQQHHYQMLDEQFAEVRAMHHDLRQQAILMQDYARRGDTQALQAFLAAYLADTPLEEKLQYTPHYTINILTRYYARLCKTEGIRFTAQYHLPQTLPVSDMDLNVVWGNLCENALEACRRMPPQAERYVEVAARLAGTKLVLQVRNSMCGGLKRKGGFFRTTKPQGGQGMRSVARVAERNGGGAVFEAEGGVFTATVMLVLQPPHADEVQDEVQA